MVDFCFTFYVHDGNWKRNKTHSISALTTTNGAVQEEDKKHFPHKWAAGNCRPYVASVRGGKALQGARAPPRARGADSDLPCVISRAHNAAGNLLDVFPNASQMKIFTSREISTLNSALYFL